MPNHITNILQATPEVIDSLKGENGDVDFNTLVPYPEELRDLTAEYMVFDTEEEVKAHNDKENHFAQELLDRWGQDWSGKLGKTHAITRAKYNRLKELYGGNLDWYSWNSEHWGTKWNAYQIESPAPLTQIPNGFVIWDWLKTVKFETAWSHPFALMVKLSEKFPEEYVRVLYADEDTGFNYGAYVLQNGGTLVGGHEPLGRGTPEAEEFAVRVSWGMSKEEWDKENGEEE